jgi:hypothetical protein
MAINFTSLLKMAKPVQGTEANVWGDIVNTEITDVIEQAVAGAVTVDVTAGNVVLTNGDGADPNQARYGILLVTGTPGTARNIEAPGTSKIYLVKNGSNGDVTIKASATSGVVVPVNVESWVFWNGSDYE